MGKFERCVEKVMAKGHDEKSARAICAVALQCFESALQPASRYIDIVEWAEQACTERPQVDRATSIIRNVKILGAQSKNGRVYTQEAMRKAVGLYEGIRVNVDHSEDAPAKPRSYAERIGRLRNVRVAQDGLRGDLVVNPKHPLGEQLLWDAENSPESCGLSHCVRARLGEKDGVQIVEAIEEVYSVDVVADPATTASLFESVGGNVMSSEQEVPSVDATAQSAAPTGEDGLKAAFRAAIVQVFDDESLSFEETRRKIIEILKAYEKLAGAGEEVTPEEKPEEAPAEEARKIAQLEAIAHSARLAVKYGLQDETLIEALAAVSNKEMREVLARRLGSEKPVARLASARTHETVDAKTFASMLYE